MVQPVQSPAGQLLAAASNSRGRLDRGVSVLRSAIDTSNAALELLLAAARVKNNSAAAAGKGAVVDIRA